MEYEVIVWKPRLHWDIDALERAPERVKRIPHELHKLDGYNERLSAVEQTTLEVRRYRGDLVQTF